MEENRKPSPKLRSTRWEELQEKAKHDPELARMLAVGEDVIQRYSDTLRLLADS